MSAVQVTLSRQPFVQSVGVALGGYVLAATVEAGVIRWLQPTEWEVVSVSDLALATALGAAVYLWRHLLTTRLALAQRERAEIVLQTQLSLAAEIQRQLLPPLPPATDGFEWAALLRPAGKIGGDFYDFVETAPGTWVVLIADVSGKGIPAAMALGSLRSTFRALASQQLAPAQIVAQLSTTFLHDWQGMPYVTCIVAALNAQARTVVYSNAGHPPGVLFGPIGTRHLTCGGPPAGLIAGATYDQEALNVHAQDTCVLLSDGVTEALAGLPLEDISRALRDHTAMDLCNTLMSAALAGPGPTGDGDWDDDRTAVVVKVRDHK